MKVSRCIAITAIAALAACSEQSQDAVTGIKPQFEHYDGHVGDFGDPDFARMYTNVYGSTDAPTMAAFVVRGSQNFDPNGKGTQFSIIAPERTLHINHGMITSYIARNGYSAVNQTLGNVESAIAASGYRATGSGLKTVDEKAPGKFTGIVPADVNGDQYMDAIIFVPVSDLQAVGGIIGPERTLFIEGRAPAKGGQKFNPKGPVSVGGTAPSVPPPPPPPVVPPIIRTHG